MISAAVQAGGSGVFLKLLYAGRHSKRSDALVPLAIRVLINRNQLRALEADEMPALIEAFGNSAVLGQQPGFDGFEIMGSEGYLLT